MARMPTAPTPTTPPTLTPTEPTPERAAAALGRCVGDPGSFLAHRFAVSPHQWHDDGYDDLLSLADVDSQLTAAGLRRPWVRVVRDGGPIDRSQWTQRVRTGSTWIDDLVHPGRALALFSDGATIVLQSLQRWWPSLTAFCRALELALGHPVQANAYLTPAGATGLAAHHDTHDVFVLQVAGTKHWVVRQPLAERPLPGHRADRDQASAQPVLFETDLRPGDCLYLPRGFIHSASTQAQTSLHLTIGVLATTAHDLLRLLVDRAADEAALRQALPAGFAASVDTAESAIKEVVSTVMCWLERLDVREVADELVVRAGRRPPLLEGQLLQLVNLQSVCDDSVVVRRPGAPCLISTVGNRLCVALGDRTIDLPAVLYEPVRRLLDGPPVPVGTLGDVLDEASRLVLVRRLIREGALMMLDGA